jgi:patatin-like phospholipase/acyl hydrolase
MTETAPSPTPDNLKKAEQLAKSILGDGYINTVTKIAAALDEAEEYGQKYKIVKQQQAYRSFMSLLEDITRLNDVATEQPAYDIKVAYVPFQPGELTAAWCVDHTGCEYISRDIPGIEKIAAEATHGPLTVHYLFAGAKP